MVSGVFSMTTWSLECRSKARLASGAAQTINGLWAVTINWSVRKPFGQEADQFALPLRMQMHIDLVDQDDGRFGMRVETVGVALDQAAGEVDDPGNHRSIAITELL